MFYIVCNAHLKYLITMWTKNINVQRNSLKYCTKLKFQDISFYFEYNFSYSVYEVILHYSAPRHDRWQYSAVNDSPIRTVLRILIRSDPNLFGRIWIRSNCPDFFIHFFNYNQQIVNKKKLWINQNNLNFNHTNSKLKV